MVGVSDTLTIPCIIDGERIDHLHIVLTDPHTVLIDGVSDSVVIVVNITSTRGAYHDPACELKPGEHPFITHDSYVIYQKAQIVRVSEIDQGLQKGIYVLHTKASPALLEKVTAGLHRSRHAKPKIQRAHTNARQAGYA